MATKTILTTYDIERYAARFGDDPYMMLGVLLGTIEYLMSDNEFDRSNMENRLREWAGGETPEKKQ